MTPRQQVRRWRFRYDFLETWLTALLANEEVMSKDEARKEIRRRCELAMSAYGFKYPFTPDDK